MPTEPSDLTADLSGLLGDADLKKLLPWFATNRAWILDQQIALCRVPAPTFLEGQRAAHISAQFASLGFEAKIDTAGNVVAWLPGRQAASVAVISAHLDTVLSPRRPDEIQLDDDGVLRGPGVADNGAGLSGLLAVASVMRKLAPAAWPLSPLFVANVGEEGEGNLTGMRYLCTESEFASRIRGVLVLDGPGHEHITCRALASRRFEVLLQGRGGHSWSDFGTVNPVHALARAVSLFADSNSPLRNPSADRYSLNVGLLQGGSTVNSIPQSASAKVDIRSEREGMIEELAESLRRCVHQAVASEHEQARRGRLQVRVREIGARPGGRLSDDAPLLSLVRAIDKQLGIQGQIDTSSTDANIPLSLGIPALAIGAGGTGGGAHTTDEWYLPEGRDLGLRRALLIAVAMLHGFAEPNLP